jgi:hypothetical protein
MMGISAPSSDIFKDCRNPNCRHPRSIDQSGELGGQRSRRMSGVASTVLILAPGKHDRHQYRDLNTDDGGICLYLDVLNH